MSDIKPYLISDDFSNVSVIIDKLRFKRQKQMADMWDRWWIMKMNRSDSKGKIVTTPHGDIVIIRKDVVAISIVKVRHAVIHHKKRCIKDDVVHIEHRKIPSYFNCNGWSDYIASYDLNGNEIKTIDTRVKR